MTTPEPGRGRAGSPQAGFTLPEVLIVLVIIAMIVGLATPTLMSRLGGARSTGAEVELEYIAAALDLYRMDTGVYPDAEQGLEALLDAPAGREDAWRGPYLRRGELPRDPWGAPYRLQRDETSGGLRLISFGRDGAPGGEGEDRDIVLPLER